MTSVQEEAGKKFFGIMSSAGQQLSLTDLLVLRGAWKGNIAWEELPEHLRVAFFNMAGAAAALVGK